MAKCKDCFHCEICAKQNRLVQIDAHTWDEYELLDDVEKFCEHFENTADVVPRAEVAREICCKIEEEIVAALESNYRALKEWDDGRCNDYILEMVNRTKGKIDALRGIEGFIAELKKKYTEERK